MGAPFLPTSPVSLTLEAITAQAGVIVLKARTIACAGIAPQNLQYQRAPEFRRPTFRIVRSVLSVLLFALSALYPFASSEE